METFELILGFVGGSGITAIILAILQRKWAKEDKQSAVVNALKVLMIDRVRYLGGYHIKAHGITLDDKETLLEKHQAYRQLGGNGHLDMIMDEVNHLPIIQN